MSGFLFLRERGKRTAQLVRLEREHLREHEHLPSCFFLGFGVWGLGFRVSGLGFRVSGLRVWGFGGLGV